MTDRMYGVDFKQLLKMVKNEFKRDNSVFSIPSDFFFKYNSENLIKIHGEKCINPVGPAAGPHTQLAQNIGALYLTGARVFELKTVQILDNLEFPKPCIESFRECYNTEWSTELSIEEACDEYSKAYVLNVFLDFFFDLTNSNQLGFCFDISVGYDLKGIKSKKVDDFLNTLTGIKENHYLMKYIEIAKKLLPKNKQNDFLSYFEERNYIVSKSVTLSTMHGCPKNEIEDICKYLMKDKKLNTCLKLNPTLLGFENVRKIMDLKGYNDIQLIEEKFQNDLNFDDAIKLVNNLKEFAINNNQEFSVKLTNTLPVKNNSEFLEGEEKYMSGTPLYLLTLGVAEKLSKELENIHFSFSGGINKDNVKNTLNCGIYPITIVTDLLKPQGLKKFYEIAKESDFKLKEKLPNYFKIKQLMNEYLNSDSFKVEKKIKKSSKKLPLFDCFKSKVCGKCVDVCPNRANYLMKFEDEDLSAKFQIIHFSELCNECGNCGTFCPYGGLPFKDKLTYYTRIDEFNFEENNGFIIEKRVNGVDVIVRLEKRKYFVSFSKKNEILNVKSKCKKELPSENLYLTCLLIGNFIENYNEMYNE